MAAYSCIGPTRQFLWEILGQDRATQEYRAREFKELKDDEVVEIEAVIREVFDGFREAASADDDRQS